MAATLVDQLLLELGLDSQKFVKGLKESQDAVKGTREAVEKHGKGIEESMHKAGDSVKELGMRFLELYAILLGARGFSEFVSKTTESDTAIGRLSASIGATSKSVSELDMIAERFGGSSQSMHASLRRLNDIYYDLAINGKALPPVLSQIMALSGTNVSYSQGPIQQMKDLSVAIQKIAQTRGVPLASYLGRQYGLDDPMVQMMIKYGPNLQKKMKELEPLALTEEQVEKAERFEKTWAQLGQNVQFAAHSFWMSLEPAVSSIMDEMIKWLELPTTHTAIVEWTEWLEKELKALPGWISGVAAEWNTWLTEQGGIKALKTQFEDFKKTITDLRDLLIQVRDSIVWVSDYGKPVADVLNVLTGPKKNEMPPASSGKVISADIKKAMEDSDGEGKKALDKARKEEAAKGYQPSWVEKLGQKFINLFDMGAHVEGVKVEGRDVNHGNPMPVWVANPSEEHGASLADAARRGRPDSRIHSGDDPGGGGSGGASHSFRNNNPGNIKYGPFAKANGASGQDASGFAIFPSVAAGEAAQRALWGGDNYKNISVEAGARKWSEGAYGAAALGVPGDKTWSQLSESERDTLIKNQRAKEGWWGPRGGIPGADTHGVNAELLARYNAMMAAAPVEVRNQTRITSGYRSTELQAKLYQRFLNGGPLAAPPGHSNHERGLAMDIDDPTGWVHQHAAEYGLHFPLGRRDWPHMQMRDAPRGRPPTGAGAFLHNHNQQVTHNTRSETVHVGEIHVHTQAKDAEGIAHNIKEAMRRDRIVRSQEGGMA